MEGCEKILDNFSREDEEIMSVEGIEPIKQYSRFVEKPFIKATQKISFSIDNLLAKSAPSGIQKCSEQKLNNARKSLKNSDNTIKNAFNPLNEFILQDKFNIGINYNENTPKSEILNNNKASNFKYSKTDPFLNFDSPACSGPSSLPKDFSKSNLEPPKPETKFDDCDEKFSMENDNDFENSTQKSDNASEISLNNSDITENEDYDAILASRSTNSFVKFGGGSSSNDLAAAVNVSARECSEESGDIEIEDGNYGKN